MDYILFKINEIFNTFETDFYHIRYIYSIRTRYTFPNFLKSYTGGQ
jgi:hypothetical protein